jgi:hypothetical protein
MGERKTGATWHLIYPFIVWVLVAIPTWTTASGVWFVAVKSMTQEIRFGSKDYCRYNTTIADGGTQQVRGAGCVAAGWSYQVFPDSLDIEIPGAVTTTLSKAAVILIPSA